MSEFLFDWDKEKNIINIAKHDVTFREAETVFDDENMIYKPDLKHSNEEDRFIVLGISSKSRLLIVCHCVRDGLRVRIISARKASIIEKQEYERRLMHG